ncbi:MAG: HD domain-containing protein [Phycisphaerales bacterium]
MTDAAAKRSILPPPAAVALLVSADDQLVAQLRAMLAPDRNTALHVSSNVGDAEIESLEVHPTVVLLDLNLPGRTPALDLLRRMRRRPETAAVPVIVLGGPEEAQLRGAVFDAGAADFLSRSPDPVELRARIRNHSEAFNVRQERNEAVAAMGRMQRQLRDTMSELNEARRGGVKPAAPSADADELRSQVEAITRMGTELSRIHDFHLLMDRILAEARGLARAEAGTIFVREGETLRFAFSQNDQMEQAGRTANARFSGMVVAVNDRSIAGWCATSGQLVNVEDAYALDARAPFGFDRGYDAVTGYRTRSVIAAPLRTASDQVLGVLQLLNAKDSAGKLRQRFDAHDERLVEHFASLATVVVERAQLTESVILRMIRIAEVRDPAETAPHIERVAGYSLVLFDEWAARRGMDGPSFERKRDQLRIAAKLHDVGKLGVSDTILKKSTKLDHDEWRQVQQHTVIGARLFADNPSQIDQTVREVVLNHHERWDGTGYPGHVDLEGRPQLDSITGLPRTGGKRGEEIPLFARIVGLADVFDALSSRRSYKEAWPQTDVLDYIRVESGRHFDPELVEIFFARLDDLRAVHEAHQG